jgi:hypothetical protein
MNKSNKSLGNSSTNTASLNNAIASIKASITPVISTGRASSNPKPLKVAGEMWVPRTFRVFLTQNIVDEKVDLTTAGLMTVGGLVGQIRILKLKVWNYTSLATTSNYIGVESGVKLTETAVTTSVIDVGNGSTLPGVTVTIPRTIASNLTSSTDIVCTVKGLNTLPDSPQRFLVEVQLEYKTNGTN